jgi:hypothetical protein
MAYVVGAWRAAAAPPADHAWLPTADGRAGHGLPAQLRAPTGSDAIVLIGIDLPILVEGDAFGL